MSEFADNKLQNVVLNNRREIKISGVQSVDSFDEYRISATCHDGTSVVIDGVGLVIKEVNLENGFIEAVGDIQGFFYDDRSNAKSGGFLKNLLFRK